MKKSLSILKLLLLGFIALAGIRPLIGQLQVSGSPVGDFRAAKGADMIYLLPPLNQLEHDARKLAMDADLIKTRESSLRRQVELSPEFNGVWEYSGGYRIWRVHVISPGALSLGLVFDRFQLDDGVRLMVYTPDMKYVKGAFSNLNNKSSGVFAVGHLPGEELIVELQVPESNAGYGELKLSELSHAYLSCPGGHGCSGDCELDINCLEGTDWQLEKKSVVRIHNLHNLQYCTGVILNNTRYDGAPLVLTAKHCIDSETGAEQSIFHFNYESPDCFGEDGSVEMSVSGAELLATGDSIDFSLVRLSITPPKDFDVYYAGWDLSDPQAGPTTTIHHPEGDVKKISSDFDAPEATTDETNLPSQFKDHLRYSFWWIKQWDMGSTEPGSSGSPLFNPDSRVIGVLSFGSARCGDSIDYDAETDRVEYDLKGNINDYYTKLDVAWDHHADSASSLKYWLDPTGTGLSSLGGLNPNSIAEKSVKKGENFTLYPNPVSTILWFSANTPRFGSVTYTVYDIRGATLLQGEGDLSAAVMLDMGGFQNGFYLLFVEYEKEYEVHKFVISR